MGFDSLCSPKKKKNKKEEMHFVCQSWLTNHSKLSAQLGLGVITRLVQVSDPLVTSRRADSQTCDCEAHNFWQAEANRRKHRIFKRRRRGRFANVGPADALVRNQNCVTSHDQ